MKEKIYYSLALVSEELEKSGYLDLANKIDRAVYLLQGRPNCTIVSIQDVYTMLLETAEEKAARATITFANSVETETIDLTKDMVANIMSILKEKDLAVKSAKIKTISYLIKDLKEI